MNTLIVLTSFLLVAAAFSIEKSAEVESSYLTQKKLDDVEASGRISGGWEVVPNSVPYAVALIVRFADSNRACQGAILSRRTILTAAFCISGSISTQVIAGAHDILRVETEQQRFSVTSASYRVHPRYANGRATRNIATILLASGLLTFTAAIQPVLLPRGSLLQESFVGFSTIVSGWGDHASGRLRSIDQLILPPSGCAILEPRFTADNLCLRTSVGNSPCRDDDGAPAAATVPGVGTVLIGIYGFFGFNNCELGHPVGLTRLTSFLDWIDQNSIM